MGGAVRVGRSYAPMKPDGRTLITVQEPDQDFMRPNVDHNVPFAVHPSLMTAGHVPVYNLNRHCPSWDIDLEHVRLALCRRRPGLFPNRFAFVYNLNKN